MALEVADDISALVPYSAREDIKMSVTYEGPIHAPIAKGTELGVLNIEIPGLPSQSYPVFASSDVAAGGIMKRLRASADKLLRTIN